MRRPILKRVLLSAGVLLCGCACWLGLEVRGLTRDVSPYLFDDLSQVPAHHVGLFLGCSERLADGRPNPYFAARVQAATELYEARKIEYILVSGDNSRVDYDETAMAKTALLRAGVPENRIVQDHAGFRTFDSVVRARQVFGLSDFVVISQRFHNERAVYLARAQGLSAVGFNAVDVHGYYGLRVHARELLAKARAVLDLKFGTRPKYLGPTITIG